MFSIFDWPWKITPFSTISVRWEDFRARREALEILRTASTLAVAQKELLVRRGEPRWAATRDVEDRVWKLLQRVLP